MYKIFKLFSVTLFLFTLFINSFVLAFHNGGKSQIEIEIPTYRKENLPKHLQNIKPIKPGSRSL